jgi:hypothetical protein
MKKDLKLTKSEVTLVKRYCSRVSDDDLAVLASHLPQEMMGDRARACEILQEDKEIDAWLGLASGVDEWFVKADSIGEMACVERDVRSKKAAR